MGELSTACARCVARRTLRRLLSPCSSALPAHCPFCLLCLSFCACMIPVDAKCCRNGILRISIIRRFSESRRKRCAERHAACALSTRSVSVFEFVANFFVLLMTRTNCMPLSLLYSSFRRMRRSKSHSVRCEFLQALDVAAKQRAWPVWAASARNAFAPRLHLRLRGCVHLLCDPNACVYAPVACL